MKTNHSQNTHHESENHSKESGKAYSIVLFDLI